MGETDESPATRTAADAAPSTASGTASGAASGAVRHTKWELRRRIRAERRSRPDAEREAVARDLVDAVLDVPEIAHARCVALYASMRSEPGTEPLRAALRARGIRVVLPIVLPDGLLDWADDTGELVAPVGFGGDEPPGPRLGGDGIRLADVVLVPAHAVDTLGRRLGQGAGYYDRALLRLDAGVPVVAVVHDGEVLDAAVEPLPDEPHDVRVHAVVTPKGYLRIGTG